MKHLKPKKWEFALVALLIIIAYILIFHVDWDGSDSPKPYVAPEGATNEYITEDAYKDSDLTACETINDEAAKAECFERTESKIVLDKSVETVKAETGTVGSATNDRKFLGLASIKKNSVYCANIVDEQTKQDCYAMFE